MYYRTDMAAELHELRVKEYSKEHKGEPDGIFYEKTCRGGVDVCTVKVTNENGEKLLGKPLGSYITVNVGRLWEADARRFGKCADVISSLIKELSDTDGAVLAVGMGNRYVTADALGPCAVKHIISTHHISGKGVLQSSGLGDLSSLAPGVLSQTGIEAVRLIKAAVASVRPSLVIIIDALAAAAIETLSTSVQITDAGISPGSGVGNDRGEISSRVLGVPVVAVGVPTVVDAAAFIKNGTEEDVKRLRGCYFCPKDSDRSVGELARLIGYSVNRVCHKGLSYEDMAYI